MRPDQREPRRPPAPDGVAMPTRLGAVPGLAEPLEPPPRRLRADCAPERPPPVVEPAAGSAKRAPLGRRALGASPGGGFAVIAAATGASAATAAGAAAAAAAPARPPRGVVGDLLLLGSILIAARSSRLRVRTGIQLL